ncbi:5'-3' exonuclease [Mycoplasma procyoni]|uniref:5'-3' exonuclease n=1 Tax=Mycoplasma procyoni TaxID=568784 RepID=UPI00197B3CE6|nr:5'-3' exonuclease [Mycoplasma procyoni]MBN3534619.1 5'-3' exonuclease [Mycoplasma procyoni]
MKNKILLVDGNLLLFRSYFGAFDATKVLSSSDGKVPTFAINTFMNGIISALNFTEATHLYIAFDSKEKTPRHEKLEDYKAGRKAAPDDLWIQYEWIKKLLENLGLVYQNIPTFEADDLVGTLAKRFSNQNHEVIVFSQDKDLLQLVDQNISVLIKKGGDFEYKNINNFFENEGIMPHQVPDYKGIAGDTSDNLKGVIGIGEKGAKKLLNDFLSLENIYLNLDKLSPKISQKLTESKENAFLCKEIATLNLEAPIDYCLDDLLINPKWSDELQQNLAYLGFITLKRKLKDIYDRYNR